MADVFEHTATITNENAEPLAVWFEPWALGHELLPGETLRVDGRSPEPGELEIVEDDAGVTFYGWSGSTLRLYVNDALIYDLAISFPGLPPGMSPRSLVELLFGGPGKTGWESDR